MNTIQVELQVLVTSNNETNAVEQIQNGRTNHNGDAVSTPAGPVPRPARYTGPVGCHLTTEDKEWRWKLRIKEPSRPKK